MSRPLAGAQHDQLSQLLANSGLSPEDRRLVHDALANSAIEGWTPDAESVALLTEFAAGNLDIDDYRQQVLVRAGVYRR